MAVNIIQNSAVAPSMNCFLYIPLSHGLAVTHLELFHQTFGIRAEGVLEVEEAWLGIWEHLKA